MVNLNSLREGLEIPIPRNEANEIFLGADGVQTYNGFHCRGCYEHYMRMRRRRESSAHHKPKEKTSAFMANQIVEGRSFQID